MAYIWLSHILNGNTPAYGGGKGFIVSSEKDMTVGDSCNTVSLKLSNHIGSHVDAPKHFIKGGKSVDSYSASDWVFELPVIIDISVGDAEIITVEALSAVVEDAIEDADLVLIRTGIEQYREQDTFWEKPPGFDPALSEYLKSRFPSLQAIGMDVISLSSFQHREVGREAHREFLGADIRVFEDLALAGILSTSLQRVIALPLRFQGADGAPTTLIAEVAE